jgi:hypothetical protein
MEWKYLSLCIKDEFRESTSSNLLVQVILSQFSGNVVIVLSFVDLNFSADMKTGL